MTGLSYLSCTILLPLLGMLFVLLSKEDIDNKQSHNAYNVALFTLFVNLLLLGRAFYHLNLDQSGLQLVERFNWLENPKIDIILGADTFSLLILVAIHIAFIISAIGVRRLPKQKALMAFSLMFLSQLTGFFLAADIFSFYLFFESMLLPLFMLIGMFGEIRRDGVLYRFFMYNFLGAVVLFLAMIILYNNQHGLLEISRFSHLKLHGKLEYFILTSIFISFLSRIPIWPFHYWISSISSNVRNPLVFILTNMLPLTGLYGFIRFLPDTIKAPLSFYISGLEVIALVTMIFIALIGFINKETNYKFFSYMTVYYIMYLLALLNHSDNVRTYIAFSCFSYLIIISSLELIASYIRDEQEKLGLSTDGSLCAVPKLAFMYSFFVLAAIGLPVSSLFVNNFLMISSFMQFNTNYGLVMIVSLMLVSATLLKDLYRLKDNSHITSEKNCISDMSKKTYMALIAIVGILFMSLIRPLWFVEF